MTSFYSFKRRGRVDHSYECKECAKKRTRALHKARRDCPIYKAAARARTVRCAYKVEMGDIVALQEAQDNNCPICLRNLDEVSRTHIDHCHTTGRVRGVLCSECNTGIGKLRDDPEFLQRAIDYLKP